MGAIYKTVTLYGLNDRVSFDAFLDTGASVNVMGRKLPDGIDVYLIGPSDVLFEDGKLEVMGDLLDYEAIVVFPKIEIDQRVVRDVEFVLVPSSAEVILGWEIMQSFCLRIDMGLDLAYA